MELEDRFPDEAAEAAWARQEEVPLVQCNLIICALCLAGRGGECHTPGCAFWCCPAPTDEQAERLRGWSAPLGDEGQAQR